MRRKSELWVVYLFLGLVALVYALVLMLGPMASPGWAAPLRQCVTDVAVTKYKDSGVFAPGHDVTYVIHYENASTCPASDIRIEDTLPISTTYVSSSGPGLILIQEGPDKVVWLKGGLSDWERGWASITVRVEDDAPVGAWVSNAVRITTMSLECKDCFDNNEYIFREEVLPPGPADLTVTKKLYSGTVGPGNEITYQIIYHNRGAETANNVRISDTLPISTTYVSDDTSKSGGFTTAMVGSTVVWTRSSVPAFAWGLSCQRPSCYSERIDLCNELYLKVRISDDFDPNTDWLEDVVEISTSDVEANYDNNLNRLTIKPEAHRLYGAAVTSVDDKTMQLLSAGGFDWMIYYLNWSETEPSNNQYYWRDLDDAIWKAWWYNLKLAVRVDRAPAWARPPGSSETAPPTNPDDLRDFMYELARGMRPVINSPWGGQRPVPKIPAYIIWNEPNLAAEWGGNAPDAAAYTALLQAAYNGVKAGDPNAWVISAGLAPTNDNSATAVDDRTYLQQMYDVPGAGGYFDLLGVNPMGFASAPDDTSDPNGYYFQRALEWRNIMSLNGDGAKKMFATEMGWLRDTDIDLGDYNWMKVSDIDQAHYLARAYHKARREWSWMGPMMTWNLDFSTFYEDTEHFHWFSVTDDGLSPLRPYLTLKNAATGGPADLWMEKELISPVTPGGDLVYLIHYTNIGGQPATGVLLTDTMPIGTIYVTDTVGGTLVGDDGIVWDIGTVDTGAREAITLTLRMTGDEVPGGILTNTVEASAVAGEPYTDDNVATVSTPIPDLSIHKSVVPNAAAPEDPITYTLVFSNAGQDTASGVVITDIVPVSVTVQSVISSGVTITDTGASPPYVWEVQDLAPGQGGVITIAGVLSPGLPIGHVFTNTATITGTTIDNVADNNTAEAGATIIVPVLSINKTVTPATGVTYHGTVTYTVVLSNNGTADATGVLFTDTLPGEVDFASWVVQPGGANVSNDEITWNGTVPAGGAITFIFVVAHSGDYGDVVTNTARYGHTVSGSGDDDATFTVEPAPGLGIAKTVAPATGVTYHGTVTYTVVLSNNGTADATGVLLTDTLPGEVDFASWVAQPSGASVVNDEITWSGTVTAGEATTFTFVVSHVGDYGDVVTNTARYGHPVGGSGDDNATFTVKGHLSIAKTADPDTDVTYHGEVTYTIVLNNSGVADANGVLFTDTLPGEVDFSRWVVQPSGASVVNDEITWSGTVTAGEATTFTFVVSHVGDYGDVVANTAYYSHTTGSGSSSGDDATFAVEPAVAGRIYLPLARKGFVAAPDLVVDSLVATSNAVTVTIRNQGNAPVADAFWVDVYFNPTKTPALNEPWDTIASHGAVWGVTTDIPAGGTLVLTTGGDYYFPQYSSTPPLPVGANVYALVDSVDYSTTYGVVQESDEGNNLFGPVVSTAGAAGGAASAGQGQPASEEGLPPRR